MTVDDDSTILKYSNGTGPGPGPEQKFFTQMQCVNSNCSEFCRNASFPQEMCIPVSGGGSAIATCDAQGLTQKFYNASTDCTGTFETASMPVGVCLEDKAAGTYFENFCDNGVPKRRIHGRRPQFRRI